MNKAFAALAISAAVFFSACQPDEPEGPVGDDDFRDTYTGNWTASEKSKVFGQNTYAVTVSKGSGSSEILIDNFYNLGSGNKVKASISGATVSIPSQNVTGQTISGSGSIASDTRIELSFTANDGAETDTASATLTR